ncbi:MAG: hypothetical protein ACI9R8_002776, partial [Candidatus Paceibacteria bacterium]
MSLFVWPEATTDFVAEVQAPETVGEGCYFVFKGSELLLRFDAQNQWLPLDREQAGALIQS